MYRAIDKISVAKEDIKWFSVLYVYYDIIWFIATYCKSLKEK